MDRYYSWCPWAGILMWERMSFWEYWRHREKNLMSTVQHRLPAKSERINSHKPFERQRPEIRRKMMPCQRY